MSSKTGANMLISVTRDSATHPDPLRQRLVGASAAEVRLVRVERGNEVVERTEHSSDVQEDVESHSRLAALKAPQGPARDTRAFSHLLGSEAVQPPPRRPKGYRRRQLPRGHFGAGSDLGLARNHVDVSAS